MLALFSRVLSTVVYLLYKLSQLAFPAFNIDIIIIYKHNNSK